jgi:surfactin synthase thioesterase subunit
MTPQRSHVTERFDVWFPWRVPRPRAATRLLCLPFAGGAALAYRHWAERFPDTDVLGVELPGHATRFREPLVTDMAALVEELADVVRALPDLPLVLFGHSLGAFIAFDLAQRLAELGLEQPRWLVASAALPPDHRVHRAAATEWSDTELIGRLRRLGGTPAEILANPELMAMSLPIIRADYRLIATRRRPPYAPLACNVAAFSGSDDRSASPREVLGWARFSSGEFFAHEFAGGHFYIQGKSGPLESALLALLGMAA